MQSKPRTRVADAVQVGAVIPRGHVRVGPFAGVLEALAEFGVDPRPLLAESRLAASDFGDPENTISLAAGSKLLRLCVERTGCEHFGLLLGQRAPVQSMGAVGYLMLSAPTVGAAVRLLTAHIDAHDRGAVVGLRIVGPLAELSYSLVEPGLERPDQIQALSIAVGHNIMRGLCGPRWRAERVSFAFARPKKATPYVEFFGVRPTFDSAPSALYFPASQLDIPLAGADAFLNRLMRQRVGTRTQAGESEIVEVLRRLLRARLPSAEVSLAHAALELGMHERTLQRRLIERGTSFREVRETLWRDVARELLESTTMPVREIASVLGYSEAAAFTRAFARWSRVTPSKWRRDRRRSPARAGLGD